jgi:hypothetical protein
MKTYVQGIHKTMVRFICIYTYKPHHSFVYTMYIYDNISQNSS